MSDVIVQGPKFQPASNEAILALGNSERKSTGQFLADMLVERGVFDDVFILTPNEADTWAGRRALRSGLSTRTGIGHSIALMYMLDALKENGATGHQIIGLNSPEPMTRRRQVWLATTKVANEKFEKEPGAEYTGNKAAWEAMKEMYFGLPTTLNTLGRVARGFSGIEQMIKAKEAGVFPAGQAIIHSERDGFGFGQMADLGRAASHGITAVMIPDHTHVEVLYASQSTIAKLTPAIFPETERNPSA